MPRDDRPQPPPAAAGRTGAWRVLKVAYAEFNRDNGGLMAAAVSFYLLLSVVPALLLGVSIAGYALGSSADAMRSVLAFAQNLLPGSTSTIEELISAVMRTRGTVGGIGLLSLLWSAMGGLATLETAINLQWHTPRRGFVASKLFALGMFFVLGLLFLATLGATSLQDWLAQRPGLGWLKHSVPVRVIAILTSLTISTTMFAIIYRCFPSRGPRWRPALEAGFLTAVAWEIAKFGYAWYVTHLANFGAIYGPLGSLVGLVLWAYYSSFLFLYGSEMAWLLGGTRHGDRRKAASPAHTGRHWLPSGRTKK
jgi:membrane protein